MIVIYLLLLPVIFWVGLRAFYADAQRSMRIAREQFKAVTGHEPPKTSMDNWFKWKAKAG